MIVTKYYVGKLVDGNVQFYAGYNTEPVWSPSEALEFYNKSEATYMREALGYPWFVIQLTEDPDNELIW